MVVRLAESLELPPRERNELLLAAGYAPVYAESALDGPELAPVRAAIDHILRGHLPYPALVVDRAGGLIAANTAFDLLTDGTSPASGISPNGRAMSSPASITWRNCGTNWPDTSPTRSRPPGTSASPSRCAWPRRTGS